MQSRVRPAATGNIVGTPFFIAVRYWHANTKPVVLTPQQLATQEEN